MAEIWTEVHSVEALLRFAEGNKEGVVVAPQAVRGHRQAEICTFPEIEAERDVWRQRFAKHPVWHVHPANV